MTVTRGRIVARHCLGGLCEVCAATKSTWVVGDGDGMLAAIGSTSFKVPARATTRDRWAGMSMIAPCFDRGAGAGEGSGTESEDNGGIRCLTVHLLTPAGSSLGSSPVSEVSG